MTPRAAPLVSCIMPTYNRRGFVPHAIRYFLRQVYPNKELIVIDDGADAVRDLIPRDPRVRYIRLESKITLGAKLNLGCREASGPLIAHWDDDDWYADWRLAYQVDAIEKDATEICGINNLLYYDLGTGSAYRYVYPADQRIWLSGSSLCYTKQFWSDHGFADIDVGMDGLFVWSAAPHCIAVLEDSTYSVLTIHPANISPKETKGVWWHRIACDEVARVTGADWPLYVVNGAPLASPRPPVATPNAAPIRNVYSCLVHESRDCVIDLVRNLRYHDQDSQILLYNGGNDPDLLARFPFERHGAVCYPAPKPMRWGWLHPFALECMEFAARNFAFDTLTIVDSDQVLLRAGYANYLGRFLADNVGMLGSASIPQPASTTVPPAIQARREIELWRPLLKRFPEGEAKFVYWTFWPSTVFTADACRELLRIFADGELQAILRKSQIWASEEIVLPTLVALLGFEIRQNPCSYDYVQFRTQYSTSDVDAALARPDVFWMHPIPRHYDNPIRRRLRAHCRHFQRPPDTVAEPVAETLENSILATQPILAAMRTIEGWLSDEEADLLISATVCALEQVSGVIVEVGSYCGKATVVLGKTVQAARSETKIYAVDPFDGRLGALDEGIVVKPPCFEKFARNIELAGLTKNVEAICNRSVDVAWNRPIALLLIDGLHDYPSVAQDFHHFEDWIEEGGYIAFHDFGDYFPGVKAFVNELLSTQTYRKVGCAGTMLVVQKRIPLHEDATSQVAPTNRTHSPKERVETGRTLVSKARGLNLR